MATINFCSYKPDKKGPSPIHLRINCNGTQVKLSTAQKSTPKTSIKRSKKLRDYV
jgi:DNA (cytosine-5)-methyltransferase 1